MEIIEEYGVEGYPFTAERFFELREKEEAIRAAQTVDSLLLSDERDFVLGHGGRKVGVFPFSLVVFPAIKSEFGFFMRM